MRSIEELHYASVETEDTAALGVSASNSHAFSSCRKYVEIDDGTVRTRKRREIFEYELSIPTTIREESSRSPTPSIERTGLFHPLKVEKPPQTNDMDPTVRSMEEVNENTNNEESVKDPVALPSVCQPQGLLPTVVVTDDMDNILSCNSSSANCEEAPHYRSNDVQVDSHSNESHCEEITLHSKLKEDVQSPLIVIITSPDVDKD